MSTIYMYNNSRTLRCKRSDYTFRMGLLTISFVILLAVLLFLFLSKPASAIDPEEMTYKYFTVVTINDGDTLWNMADQYGYNNRHNDFVKEVMEMNNMKDSKIIEGQWIVVPFYSTELKLG